MLPVRTGAKSLILRGWRTGRSTGRRIQGSPQFPGRGKIGPDSWGFSATSSTGMAWRARGGRGRPLNRSGTEVFDALVPRVGPLHPWGQLAPRYLRVGRGRPVAGAGRDVPGGAAVRLPRRRPRSEGLAVVRRRHLGRFGALLARGAL